MIPFLSGIVAAVVAVAVSVLPVTALAQSADRAVVNAVTFEAIPAGGAIFVRVLDNSDEMTAIKREVETRMRAAGYAVSEGPARLVMTVQSSGELGNWSPQEQIIKRSERVLNDAGSESGRNLLHLFSNRDDGLINSGQGGPNVTRTRVRLEASVEDSRSGKNLWRGWVAADVQRGDSRPVLRAMVPTLVDRVGTTVREQPVTLP